MINTAFRESRNLEESHIKTRNQKASKSQKRLKNTDVERLEWLDNHTGRKTRIKKILIFGLRIFSPPLY